MYGPADEEYATVGISARLRSNGHAQVPERQEFLAEAQADGYPAPPWIPAGTNGMRADAASRHRIRWRGPHIQGPAAAPLRVRETAHHLST